MLTVWTDGSNKPDGSATKAAWIIKFKEEVLEAGTQVGGKGWSDVAEYRAILCALHVLRKLDAFNHEIRWYSDSLFVINQMSGKWQTKRDKKYSELAIEAQRLAKEFSIEWNWIPREENQEADELSKIQ